MQNVFFLNFEAEKRDREREREREREIVED
jgi:hypothetical protein